MLELDCVMLAIKDLTSRCLYENMVGRGGGATATHAVLTTDAVASCSRPSLQ
jgi:hypothetical protein